MEKEYRRLLEEIRDAYFVIQDGKIAFINDRYAEVHGYNKEELLGMPACCSRLTCSAHCAILKSGPHDDGEANHVAIIRDADLSGSGIGNPGAI